MGPVDEFRGAKYIGKGFGSRHAVTHGINGDFALIAETTDFGVTWIEAGAAYFKITLEGRGVYTPRIPPRGAVKDNPNALIKMIPVIEAIEKWAVEYENKYTVRLSCREKWFRKSALARFALGRRINRARRRKVVASTSTCACGRRWCSPSGTGAESNSQFSGARRNCRMLYGP